MKTKQTAKAKAIEILLAAGFVEDGATPTEHVRIATTRVPVFGGVGGEARTLGGRQRFKKPGTLLKATVGSITTCFYEVENGQTRNLVAVPTKREDRIAMFANGNLAQPETA